MGLFSDLFKKLIKFFKECDKKYPENGYEKELNNRLTKIGAYASVWYQTFSGKIISSHLWVDF
jgi:hypothetical protein